MFRPRKNKEKIKRYIRMKRKMKRPLSLSDFLLIFIYSEITSIAIFVAFIIILVYFF